MAELVINNHDFISMKVSLFFLFHKYHMKPLQLLEKLKSVQSVKSSVQKADQIIQKMNSWVWLTRLRDAWAELFAVGGNRRALTIACMLQGLQQLCGFVRPPCLMWPCLSC